MRKKKAKESKSSSQSTEKQQLGDLEHIISMEVGTFLVLLEEGTPQQISMAKQKAKTALIKYGPDMHKISLELGGDFPTAVEDFLNSVDAIVHSYSTWVDEAEIKHCYKATRNLERNLL